MTALHSSLIPDFPLVTAVVPAYNAEKHIRQCLDALTRQDYPANRYRIIVVNDGSLDATATIVENEYPSVSLLSQENAGPASARNTGAVSTKSDLLLFTDSDCVPRRDWVSRMVSSFTDLSVMAVKGAYRTNQRKLVARFCQVEFEERYEMLKRVDSIDMVDTYSAGYRRALFQELGGFDTRFPTADSEDTELSYRLSEMGHRMVFNPCAIVTHLDHPASLARYGKVKFGRGYWRMRVYKMYPHKAVKDSYTPQSLKLQVLTLFLAMAALPLGGLVPAAVFLALFLLCCLPFIRFAFQRDPLVGVMAFSLLGWRALVIGLGVIWGGVTAGLEPVKRKV